MKGRLLIETGSCKRMRVYVQTFRKRSYCLTNMRSLLTTGLVLHYGLTQGRGRATRIHPTADMTAFKVIFIPNYRLEERKYL